MSMYFSSIPFYNQNLLKRALAELGKSILIVAGVGYGVVKALDILAQDRGGLLPAHDPEDRRQHAATDSRAGQKATTDRAMSDFDSKRATQTTYNPPEPQPSRLDVVEERMIRMEKRLEVLIAPLERLTARTGPGGNEHFMTRGDLNAAMEQFSRKLEAETERRFEIQDRSVQSLRTMMARTDELLEQVIENIESMRITA